MPCGGIYPISGTGNCFHCNKPGAHHFCEEWDCYIHARCVPDFLKGEEGIIVIHHKHDVILRFDLEEETT